MSSHPSPMQQARSPHSSHHARQHSNPHALPPSPPISRLPPPPPPPPPPLSPHDRPASSYYDPTSEARAKPRDVDLAAAPSPSSYPPASPLQRRLSFGHQSPPRSNGYPHVASPPARRLDPARLSNVLGPPDHAPLLDENGLPKMKSDPTKLARITGRPLDDHSPPTYDEHGRPRMKSDPRKMQDLIDKAQMPPPQQQQQQQPPQAPSPSQSHHAPLHTDSRPTSSHYDPVRGTSSPAPPPQPARKTNPMAMMNLLADSSSPPETRAPPVSPPPPPASKPSSRKAARTSTGSQHTPKHKNDHGDPPKPSSRRTSNQAHDAKAIPQAAPEPPAPPRPLAAPPQQGPPGLTVRDTEAAYREIEARDLSDVEIDLPGWDGKQEYRQASHKRTMEIQAGETVKRKRRRLNLMAKYYEHFKEAADRERQVYLETHEAEVTEEVRQREIEEDKERKKDQQRKRRREKAVADEKIKLDEAQESLLNAKDDEERAKLEKEIQRSEKKIRDTEQRLQGVTPTKEYNRNESPHAGNAIGKREKEIAMEGGLMTSFYTGNGTVASQSPFPDAGTTSDLPAASGRGRGRGGRGGGAAGAGGRARKSKEQKQAEKDNAARAQLFLDSGQDLPPLAPKEEERLASYAEKNPSQRDDVSDDGGDDATPAAQSFDVAPTAGLSGIAKFESKGYNQIYEQITRDLAKGIPKVVRIKNSGVDTKQSNARKTAQLAAKEARRWQMRTNKSTKDVAARAKRAMREMLGFWKHNERDERELRKAAERQELDRARKAEAEREANRQKRKLNFLISQTELYSHFIGKKVKTDEIEKHGNDGEGVAPTANIITDDKNATNVIDMPDPSGKIGKKITNFDELDFDADDETALQQAAMTNAQHAIKEAQDRAKAFDEDRDGAGAEKDLATAQQDMDEGELNFQNPTSLQSMDVAQPKMLTCQLKEYQLKGLNWLVNLYEQGINGILADEMGLGKTVQSISVMAYLAEVHNIWGPFLVIAPASTLHNWQQEITRFVPSIKVLPYWGNAKDRKILRKFWDRKHITYSKDSQFHVLVTSYQLVVQDTPYFQKVKWQYMILDEAQAIKSSQSSRWKALLGFHCRNRLLLTGTPIQNNMQELWALLHFIMPSLFDSHDEFSEWFSKDIENHAQSNTKLNEDQLKRLHMILKPFMLRRIKKHVQKELGDKIEEDVFCDLTYRQRAYYTSLRNKISILDLIEKAAVGDDQDTATLMNLVMQFRKVCNHPDLFERADVWSPLSVSGFAETASFMREGYNIQVTYSVRNLIEYWLPAILYEDPGKLDVPGPANASAGWRNKALTTQFTIWDESNVLDSQRGRGAFSWLRFAGQTAGDVCRTAHSTLLDRTMAQVKQDRDNLAKMKVVYDDDDDEKDILGWTPVHSMLNIVKRNDLGGLAAATEVGLLQRLLNVSRQKQDDVGYSVIEACYLPAASAPPIEMVSPSKTWLRERETTFFNMPLRRALYPIGVNTEEALLRAKVKPADWPITNLLPAPESQKQRYTSIQVPSMRRFVTDSGKLARLDRLLRELKEGGHRVLLYFQMTRMIDLMEEYLTYRNYKYCRLDGSTKLEDRRDTVAAFQSSPDIFVFLLSTRAGGLGINLTSADTVIFYDSDWNPTIDSQAMDRAHRLGQTRQVTVYRLITRGTIEERIRKRALQKEEVQRVVISGHAGGDRVVDFNNRSRENNRTKDIAMWLADDDQAAAIEQREAEVLAQEARDGGKTKKRRVAAGSKRKEMSMDDMYHEGEGKFDDGPSHEPSGAATPVSTIDGPPLKKRKGLSKKAKTVKQRLAVIDGDA